MARVRPRSLFSLFFLSDLEEFRALASRGRHEEHSSREEARLCRRSRHSHSSLECGSLRSADRSGVRESESSPDLRPRQGDLAVVALDDDLVALDSLHDDGRPVQ